MINWICDEGKNRGRKKKRKEERDKLMDKIEIVRECEVSWVNVKKREERDEKKGKEEDKRK